jgi:catechol 2,3-dioxygenase-like lactoylglutathione lyase family enzyme
MILSCNRRIVSSMSELTRRSLLGSFGYWATSRALSAQATPPPIRVRSLNHMTLAVTDIAQSQHFYQGLFGLPVQARQAETTILRIGPGPQYVALRKVAPNAKPGFHHFCMTVAGFSQAQVFKSLADHGVSRTSGATTEPLKAWVRVRGEDAGGGKEGTPELYFTDPDGIVVQLQDTTYCGGAGHLGSVCLAKPEPAPRKGLLAVRALSHFTITVSNPQRSRDFYQRLFGLPIQAYQGATPALAVGAGPQFLMFAGGPKATPTIGHGCFTMDSFDPDKVLKALADFGVSPRGDARGPVGPLKSYVSMRMEDRGGARDGTPELYFTDPDGILMQLQDVSYCGGGGYFGEACPARA